MDYPDKIAALVLVAPSLDPELEKPRWYNNLADYKLMSWLLPTELDLANLEVMALPDELRQMGPLWSTLDLPITLIQGEKDKLVHPDNADFAEKMVPRNLRVVRLDFRRQGAHGQWRIGNLDAIHDGTLFRGPIDRFCLVVGARAAARRS